MSTETVLPAFGSPTPTTQFALQVDNDNSFVLSEQDGYCDRLALGGRVVEKAMREFKDIAIRILESSNEPTDGVQNFLEAYLNPGKLALNGEILERSFNQPKEGPHDRIVTMYDDTGKLRLANRAYADMAKVPAKTLKAIWNEQPEAIDRLANDPKLNPAQKEEERQRLRQAWNVDKLKFLKEIYDTTDAVVAYKRIVELAQNENPKSYEWVGRSRRGKLVHSHTMKFQGAAGSVRDMRLLDEDAVRLWVAGGPKRQYGEFKLPEGEYFKESKGGKTPWDNMGLTNDVNRVRIKLKGGQKKSSADIPKERMDMHNKFVEHLTQVLGVGEFLWNDGLYLQSVWGDGGLEMANKAFCRYLGWSVDEAKNLEADGEYVAAIAAEAKDADTLLRSCAVGERDGDDHRYLEYRIKTRGQAECAKTGRPAIQQRVLAVTEHVWRLLDGHVFRQMSILPPTA